MNEYREEEPAIVAPSNARELFDTLAAARNARIAAEARELDTIHRLCLAYHAVDEDAFGEAAEKLIYHGADGTPAVAEYLSLEVSALLGITPGSGATLIGQVLNCVYRHPLLWDAVQAGWVRWRRALDVIGEVNSAGLDAAAARWVDQRITPLLATLSPARVRRTLAGLISLADPEAARRRDDNPRRTRHATFWASGGPCRDLTARMLLSDAMALDTTLDQLAAALAAQGDEDALDIRRSTALGALADPEYALSLLQGHATPKPLGQATVVLHLSESSLADDPAGQDRTIRLQALPDDLETKLIQTAERGQVRTGEGSVRHVEVFRTGGVRTPIIGRPRPLPGQRHARPTTPSFAKSQINPPKPLWTSQWTPIIVTFRSTAARPSLYRCSAVDTLGHPRMEKF